MKEIKVVIKKLPMKKIKKPCTLTSLTKKCQVEFNAFIRHRDKGKKCVSCNEIRENIQCGHYFSVRLYPRLRFDELNTAGECAKCNGFRDDHLIWYRYNLIERIGLEKYNELEKQAIEIKNGKKIPWTRFELEQLFKKYKNLNNQKEILN